MTPPTDAFLHGDAAQRKQAPMAEGLLWYFPDALACVANVSKRGNDQHNPGQPMHHARGKSTDHADCILRHLAHAGSRDSDGVRESAKVAWRALALLQEEIERDTRVPLPRNAWVEPPPGALHASMDRAIEATSAALRAHKGHRVVVPARDKLDAQMESAANAIRAEHPLAAEALRMRD